MSAYLAEMAGLGMVGFDPLGAIIMLAFIAGGSRFFHTLVFTLVNWLVTVLVAVVVGLAFTAVAATLRSWAAAVPLWVWALAEVLAAAGLLVWAIVRLRRGPGAPSQREPRPASVWTVGLVSAGFALAAFVDPGYSGAIVVSATHPIWETTIGMTLWFALTQSPLIVLCVAAGVGKTAAAGAWLQKMIGRMRRPISYGITALIIAVVVLLAADALLLSLTGRFLPQL